MQTYNRTQFENVESMISGLLHEIKRGTNNWRQRNIVLYEHPRDAGKVISDGVTFDGSMRVISEESREDWARELSQVGNFVTN